MEMMTPPLLDVCNVRVYYPATHGLFGRRTMGLVKAVDGINLTIGKNETVGLVGESGCGKSTLARAILQVIPITEGTIRFEGNDLARMGREELRRVRPRLQMVFQDPFASLNPRMTVFDTLAEPLLVHRLATRQTVAAKVASLMERVELATHFMKKYPHEFSGGQRQRIAIARALALEPRLIIADEPVSALDVSVQAQILNLFTRLVAEERLSILLISHDLAVVRHLSRRIAVMYLGHIVEYGPANDVITHPLHPYTRALLNAVPEPDPVRERARLYAPLQGDPPSPLNPPSGCPFHTRCPLADDACAGTIPPFQGRTSEHQAACLKIGHPAAIQTD